MKKLFFLSILSLLMLSACSTKSTPIAESDSSAVAPITSNKTASEYTISGTYSTPEIAPDYVVITPNSPTIGDITIVDFISPTVPSGEDLLNLFNLLPTSERPKDCPYYRNGKVTLTIKNLKKVEATSSSTSSSFQADIVSIDELGKAECYSY